VKNQLFAAELVPLVQAMGDLTLEPVLSSRIAMKVNAVMTWSAGKEQLNLPGYERSEL